MSLVDESQQYGMVLNNSLMRKYMNKTHYHNLKRLIDFNITSSFTLHIRCYQRMRRIFHATLKLSLNNSNSLLSMADCRYNHIYNKIANQFTSNGFQ